MSRPDQELYKMRFRIRRKHPDPDPPRASAKYSDANYYPRFKLWRIREKVRRKKEREHEKERETEKERERQVINCIANLQVGYGSGSECFGWTFCIDF